MSEFEAKTHCRICSNPTLKKYADFGYMPLANSLNDINSEGDQVYPLQVYFCEHCAMSQLGVVVNPTILYENYPYQSSISNTFKKHCRKLAVEIKEILKVENPSVIDIASNDGCLLNEFRKEGYSVYGVEPAENLVDISREKGIPTHNAFWNYKIQLDKADVITATNVFAHVDDLDDFVGGVVSNLKENGVFCIEVPWLHRLILRTQFDTIYHEHLSYFLLKPIKQKLRSFGLEVFRCEMAWVHGGTLRVYASNRGVREKEVSVGMIEALELGAGLYDFSTYEHYSKRVDQCKEAFLASVKKLEGKRVVGYGACAKGAMLINSLGMDNKSIIAIADDTPSKQGKYMPGCDIPIVTAGHMREMDPEVMILFAWNFAPELIEKTRSWFKGKYLIQLYGAYTIWREFTYQEWAAMGSANSAKFAGAKEKI